MASRTPRLLMTGRDPGAVGHLWELWGHFRALGWDGVTLAAHGPALRALADAGAPALPFAGQAVAPGQDPGPLLQAARDLLQAVRPDLALTVLSTDGAGIDEAVAVVAGCPVLCLQDYWGDVNLQLEAAAGLYLVLDEFAVELTRRRFGLPAVAVGSPKHAAYARLDIPAMRRAARERMGAGPSRRVLGWFGQSPAIPGHEQTVRDLAAAAAALPEPPLFLVRGHPKYPEAAQAHTAQARDLGLDTHDATGRGDAESWLCGCDLVCTVYSTCGLDHAYLSGYSPEPLGQVLYLVNNPEIRDHLERAIGLSAPPLAGAGLGRLARPGDDLGEALGALLAPGGAGDYHANTLGMVRGNPLERVTACLLEGFATSGSTQHEMDRRRA